jgi:predicted nuclease of predicted toxin-antitoxin system
MRIKLDENIPAGVAEFLGQSGHDVETVPEEGLSGRSDNDVWAKAQEEGRFLITQDLDSQRSR